MFDTSSPDTGIAPHSAEAERARGVALRLLALRPRTAAEMRQRLGQRFAGETAERTVGRLQAEGLLNDADFARQWRESRERRKPRSQSMIERELKQRGVAEDVISEAMDGFDSCAAAHRAAARYAARQSGSDRAAFDRRVGAFLGRRGFEPEVIRQTLRQLREELEIASHSSAEGESAGE